LERAYQAGHPIVEGTTMYVPGSHTLEDWLLDAGMGLSGLLYLIGKRDLAAPLRSLLLQNHRFREPRELYEKGGIERMVGHSLGGALVTEVDPSISTVYNTADVPGFNSERIASATNRRVEYDPVSIYSVATNDSYTVPWTRSHPHSLSNW
jgi:hypothetical protein